MIKWLKDWGMFLIPTVMFLAVFIIPFILGSHSSVISVPAEFCKAQQTGQSKTEDVLIQSCAAYDSKMNCTAPITNWTTETRYETNVTCQWSEWR